MLGASMGRVELRGLNASSISPCVRFKKCIKYLTFPTQEEKAKACLLLSSTALLHCMMPMHHYL